MDVTAQVSPQLSHGRQAAIPRFRAETIGHAWNFETAEQVEGQSLIHPSRGASSDEDRREASGSPGGPPQNLSTALEDLAATPAVSIRWFLSSQRSVDATGGAGHLP